jgi:uncharacterized protein YndB with AHSA1/START domain
LRYQNSNEKDMKDPLIAKGTIAVNAPASHVWSSITNPETLRQIMLGMQPESDWKVGSELRWIGRHEEKPNDNARGSIQVMDPNNTFSFTFFYPGYGYPDVASNYNTVTFALSQASDTTIVEVTQGDFSVFKEGETFRDHSQTFWNAALAKLKEVVEGQK